MDFLSSFVAILYCRYRALGSNKLLLRKYIYQKTTLVPWNCFSLSLALVPRSIWRNKPGIYYSEFTFAKVFSLQGQKVIFVNNPYHHRQRIKSCNENHHPPLYYYCRFLPHLVFFASIMYLSCNFHCQCWNHRHFIIYIISCFQSNIIVIIITISMNLN